MSELRCRHDRTLMQGCRDCLGPADWVLAGYDGDTYPATDATIHDPGDDE